MPHASALQMISLARRAGRIALGEQAVSALIKTRKARLVVAASDISAHTLRQLQGYVAGTKQILASVPFTKQEIGAAVGWESCGVAGFTDIQLALAFVQSLTPTECWEGLQKELSARAQRAERRKKAKKHVK